MKGPFHVPASESNAWWASLLHRKAKFAAAVLGVVAAVTAFVTIVLKKRGANDSVVLGEGKPMGSVKY